MYQSNFIKNINHSIIIMINQHLITNLIIHINNNYFNSLKLPVLVHFLRIRVQTTIMSNITIYKSATLVYKITNFFGISPFRIAKVDNVYRIVSKPIDYLCCLFNFSMGMYIIYLSIIDRLGVEKLSPNEMTRQGSLFLLRTVIPLNSIAIIVTYIRRQTIIIAIDKMHSVDQHLDDIECPIDLQSELQGILFQMILSAIVTIVSSMFTYLILRDITDAYTLVYQLILCCVYNANYLLFMGHFVGSQQAIKRRFINLNHGLK